ncbi:hypothetical protein PLICRDRAFT_367695 [Plicaturopsis crispa FD-325 SS-3]|uniref:Zn(2)-C6 fungal-type domain-containing protein n=1 Tax=Plicaturopsis crispa FD-325 SS-3 TaxID=944288 RepID=A0A0C9T7B4_PLICR|nr:hypothetical protein PLICRDRAFT_367695 [Plicaturopsis crispa FD-325 SS-3]
MYPNANHEGNSSHRIASTSQPGHKKRRVEPACDTCRYKKIRCDGSPGIGKCQNCVVFGSECTYSPPGSKKPESQKLVREGPESRLRKLESLLANPRPSGDFSRALNIRVHPSWFTDEDKQSSSDDALQDFSAPSLFTSSGSMHDATQSAGDNHPESEDVEDGHDFLTEHLENLHLTDRCLGRSSGVTLIHHVQEMKLTHSDANHERPLPHIRHRFWRQNPWQQYAPLPERRDFFFPESDLLAALVDLYFDRLNIYFPLLHRPTFERGVADGQHLLDDGFGATVLLVCALGSRYSSDPRVFLVYNETDLNSAGWKWFNQVQHRSSIYAPLSVHELQVICLSALFLQASAALHVSWTSIGLGLRLAISSSVNRRRFVLTVEDESWKRAFWVLVCLDRITSASLGRPGPMQGEDFDLDLPKSCDDEYWENAQRPEQNFRQPPGKPAATDFFICLIKLTDIIALALRTVYAVNKSKIPRGYAKDWEQTIVAELDSALNQWLEDVPDHLRWDPLREDALFFNQSAALHASYYYVQILIHRPYIPSPNKSSPVSFPSLAICTNAARSSIHALVHQYQRFPDHILMQSALSALMSSNAVLLLNIWGGRRSGVSINTTQEMVNVYRCMEMLKNMEERWPGAGRLWDILSELVAVGDLPFHGSGLTDSRKRRRDYENDNGSHGYNQPIQSDDLGKLPLKNQIHFDPVPTGLDLSRWLSTDVHQPVRDDQDLSNQPSLFSSDSTPASVSSTTMPTTPFQHAPLDTYAAHDIGTGLYQPSVPGETDGQVPDAVDVWSTAPTIFELDEWGAYIMGMIERE